MRRRIFLRGCFRPSVRDAFSQTRGRRILSRVLRPLLGGKGFNRNIQHSACGLRTTINIYDIKGDSGQIIMFMSFLNSQILISNPKSKCTRAHETHFDVFSHGRNRAIGIARMVEQVMEFEKSRENGRRRRGRL